MHRIRCSEIWGGNRPVDTSVCTSVLTASIHSSACGSDSGGDIYYLSVCSYDNLTRIAVADVVGHGAAASVMSRWLYEALNDRLNSLNGFDVLTHLNGLTLDQGFDAITTAAVVSYYSGTGKLYFSYAGHPPMIVRRRGLVWSALPIDGAAGLANLPLGMFPDVRYDQCEVQLEPHDRLVLYTDGVSERPNQAEEHYGVTRLRSILERTGHLELADVKQAILNDLELHSEGQDADDDCTLLIIEVTPESATDASCAVELPLTTV